MSTLRTVHVISRGKGWGIFKIGNQRFSRKLASKSEAIKIAHRYLGQGYDLVIHNMDGRVEKWIKSSK